MNNIGKQLKDLRKIENLTQKDFAKRLLISQSYLSGLENGNEIPTNKLIKLICLEFGVREEWLVNSLGEMYDEYFENDKTSLSEVSNSALLKIMMMLSTNSNVEYGFYANQLDAFASTLERGKLLNDENKLQYLELIQQFILDFDRMTQVAIHKYEGTSIDVHKEVLFEDTAEITSFLKKLHDE